MKEVTIYNYIIHDDYYSFAGVLNNPERISFSVKLKKDLSDLLDIKIRHNLIKPYYSEIIFQACQQVVTDNLMNPHYSEE